MTTYKIVRFYENSDYPSEKVKSGLTLQEAQMHCMDPQTSSKTCTTSVGRARTRRKGNWFEGYTTQLKG